MRSRYESGGAQVKNDATVAPHAPTSPSLDVLNRTAQDARVLSSIAFRRLALACLVLHAVGCRKKATEATEGIPEAPPRPTRLVMTKLADIPMPSGRPSSRPAVSADGQHVVIGGSDGSVVVAALREGGGLGDQRRLAPHRGAVRAVGFTRDGQALITGGDDGALVITELATGRTRQKLDAGGVQSIAQAADSTLIAVGTTQGDVSVFRSADGSRVFTASGHAGAIDDLCFSANGRLVFTAGADGIVRRWNLDKGKLDGRPLPLPGPNVALRLAGDHRTLVLVGLHGLVVWIDTIDWKELGRRRASTAPLLAVALLPEGRAVVVDRAGRLFETDAAPKDPRKATAVEVGTARGAMALASVDRLVSSSTRGGGVLVLTEDGALVPLSRSANAATLTPSQDEPGRFGFNGSVRAIALHPTRPLFALADNDRVVLGSLQDRARTPDQTVSLGAGGVTALRFVTTSDTLVVGRGTGRVARVESGVEPRVAGESEALSGAVRALAVAATGVIVAGDDRAIVALDLGSGRRSPVHALHTGRVVALALTSDGTRLMSSDSDGLTVTWSLVEQRELARLRSVVVRSLRIDPTDTLAAATLDSGKVTLWEVDRLVKKKQPHLHARGQHLVDAVLLTGLEEALTLDRDGTLRLRRRKDGSALGDVRVGERGPFQMRVGVNGTTVLTGGMDPVGSAKAFLLQRVPTE